jgi:hypothetical protein
MAAPIGTYNPKCNLTKALFPEEVKPLSISPNLNLNARNLSQERTQKPVSFVIPQYTLRQEKSWRVLGTPISIMSNKWVGIWFPSNKLEKF